MVVCLEWGADLHIAQLMPLPLAVSCLSNIQIDFTFLVPAHQGSPRQRAVVCVCVADNNCTYNDPMGRSYMGKKYTTVSNKRCSDWSNQRAYPADQFPDGSYDGAANYCRNPRPYDEDRTWCYWHGRRWDLCLLQSCREYHACYSCDCLQFGLASLLIMHPPPALGGHFGIAQSLSVSPSVQWCSCLGCRHVIILMYYSSLIIVYSDNSVSWATYRLVLEAFGHFCTYMKRRSNGLIMDLTCLLSTPAWQLCLLSFMLVSAGRLSVGSLWRQLSTRMSLSGRVRTV